MNCMEARRMVTPFLKKELSDKDTEQFLKHVEHCSDCMEELDMYFMVYRALDTLDSGMHNEYDFQKMMHEEIRAAKLGIIRRKITRAAGYVTLVLAELLLIFSVYTGYEMKNSEVRHSAIQRAIHRLHSGHYEELQSEAELQSELNMKLGDREVQIWQTEKK